MDLTIMEVAVLDSDFAIAKVVIGYHELVMRCELDFHRKDKKVFVRMPEHFYGQKNKVRYCSWFTDEISREFQKAALKAIYKKTGWDDEAVSHMYHSRRKKKDGK